MPNQNPFAPNSGLAFLTGLATSTMGAFKDEHDRRMKEDTERKQMDYQLLMDALNMRVKTGNITPTEVSEILTRGVDIFKPQGHGGIKEKLGEVFGRGKPYEMQSGNILANAKPKANVTVGGSTEPITFGNGVTLPPPPSMTWHEPTLREQEMQDKEQVYGFQLEKALAIEDARDVHKREARREQNQSILDRHLQEIDAKDRNRVTLEIRKRAAMLTPSDPDNPASIEMAANSLRDEQQTKLELGQSRIEVNRKRLEQIDAGIKAAQDRIEIARKRLSAGKAADWNKDPQVKGAWAKVNQYKGQAQSLRTQAAVLYSKGDLEGAATLEAEAEKSETVMQDVINTIEQRIQYLNGGVNLPSPPSRTSRGKTKFTRTEILAQPGATEATVERARQRGLLAP